MSIFSYILLFLVVMASGGLVFLIRRKTETSIKLLLSFSGAYLFSITVLYLIPEVYYDEASHPGVYILLGFLIQVLLEFFSRGVEHGHIHAHDMKEQAFPVTIMLSLCIHSFLEGMPLGSNFDFHIHHTHNQLLTGIILHKIPISIVLMTMFLRSNIQTPTAFAWLALFALMLPAGVFTGNTILPEIAPDITALSHIILAIVVGILLHISTTILFETSENHRFNTYKFIVIIVGASLAFIHF